MVANIPALVRQYITLIEDSSAFTDNDYLVTKSLASSYRVLCENNARIVLRDHLSHYPEVQSLIRFKEKEDELSISSPVVRRDLLRHYTEWAHRYGAKAAEDDNMEVELRPENGEPEWNLLIGNSNALIEDTNHTKNDISLALQLTYYYFNQKDRFEGQTILTMIDTIHDEVTRISEKHDDLDWDLLGGLFHTGRRMAQEDAMESLGHSKGRRELIQEVKNSELTPNEWFKQNTE